MFKLIGIITVILSSAAFGFYKGAALKFRQKRLLDICLFIEAASVRIRTGENMKSIILSAGDKAGFHIDGYRIFVAADNLKTTDIKLAEDFIKGLGMGDTEAELKRCEVFRDLFAAEFKKADTELKEKGTLYGKLGVFAGLLIGIVLI